MDLELVIPWRNTIFFQFTKLTLFPLYVSLLLANMTDSPSASLVSGFASYFVAKSTMILNDLAAKIFGTNRF
jgi:4-hydroxybenzoate polyprenyltransferase